jgi:hypothetical protein
LLNCKIKDNILATKEFSFVIEFQQGRTIQLATKEELDYFNWIVNLRAANAMLRNVCVLVLCLLLLDTTHR